MAIIRRVRPTISIGVLLCFIFVAHADAAPPVPPEGFPECRRGIEGLWYSTSWKDDGSKWSETVVIEGDKIWNSFYDETRRMTLIETDEVRHFFSLDEPFFQRLDDNDPFEVFNYIVIENPMGWLGLSISETVWPCAMTITYCRQRWLAEEIMKGKPIDYYLASFGCGADNYVPYQPVPDPNP